MSINTQQIIEEERNQYKNIPNVFCLAKILYLYNNVAPFFLQKEKSSNVPITKKESLFISPLSFPCKKSIKKNL